MAFAGGVFYQDDVAITKDTGFPVADGGFHFAFENDDVLALGGVVPVVVVVAVCGAEDDAGGVELCGHPADVAVIGEGDIEVFKMGFALFIGVDAGDFHNGLLFGLLFNEII